MISLDKWRLPVSELKCQCEMEDLEIKSTEDLKPLKGIIGQERAIDAMSFGLKMKKRGYNVYVAGIRGTGRSSYTYSMVEKVAKYKRNHKDWVYVYNFKMPDEPIALSFEGGIGREFKKDVEVLVSKLVEEVPKVFSSREYEARSTEIVQRYEKMSQNLLQELNEFSRDKGFYFQQSPQGLVTIPLKDDGNFMSDEEYSNMTEEEYNAIREKSAELNKEVTEYLNRMRSLEQKLREKLQDLDKKTGDRIVSFYIEELIEKYGDTEKTLKYLNDMKEDIIENIMKFKVKFNPNQNAQQQQQNPFAMMMPKEDPKRFLLRYNVNLFIDNSELRGAPIVNETNPTYYNLTGMIEYKNEMGVLTTNFMELKPGALHKANGGFLILYVKEIFSHPFAWEALKRALKTGKIAMETLNKQYGYIVTSTLKPEPIDIDIKVILIGDYYNYSLLYSYDEDFRKLFKIMADFDTEVERSDENIHKFARFIAGYCEDDGLKPFDKTAIKKIVEYSTRIAENKHKLSAKFNQIVEIIYEADALSEEGNTYITEKDVLRAIEQKKYRNNKYEERLNELFKEGTLLIDIEGSKIGQINGLAVMGTGEYSFGKPARITASTYKGRAGIINVEREVRHSGSIHDKGVLILSGYLGEKYGRSKPLSISTSITFEQNYSGIDGDSASSTELYVVISSIADIPIRQDIAVTGSVSQKGEIQPIGGVNEKIEGFYDVCKLKGLTGNQGVIIPIQNVRNLMVRDDVIEAVERGEFHIYAISHVDEGLEILTGLEIDEIHKKVEDSLEKFREEEKDKSKESDKKESEDKSDEKQEENKVEEETTEEV